MKPYTTDNQNPYLSRIYTKKAIAHLCAAKKMMDPEDTILRTHEQSRVYRHGTYKIRPLSCGHIRVLGMDYHHLFCTAKVSYSYEVSKFFELFFNVSKLFCEYQILLCEYLCYHSYLIDILSTSVATFLSGWYI